MAGLSKAHFVNTVKKWKGGAKGVQCEEAVGDRLRGAETERSNCDRLKEEDKWLALALAAARQRNQQRNAYQEGHQPSLPPVRNALNNEL